MSGSLAVRDTQVDWVW